MRYFAFFTERTGAAVNNTDAANTANKNMGKEFFRYHGNFMMLNDTFLLQFG